jgi:hypothetical protein
MGSLGAQQTHDATLSYPETGSARADVVLTGGALPAVGSLAVLTVGDLPVTTGILSSDYDAPDRPRVVLVTGLGWENGLAAPVSYQNDAGVRLSTILRDLAALASFAGAPSPIDLGPSLGGTSASTLTDATIGTTWGCPASSPLGFLRVRDALSSLTEQGFAPPWRVDPDGVTRWGLRSGGEVTARQTIMSRNLGVGLRVVGLDRPSAFLPGNTIDGGAPIRRLIVHDKAGSLTADVWSDGRLTFASRIKRIVASAFPQLLYGHPRTYVVAAVRVDGRLDLAPPPDAPYLEALPAVSAWTLGGALVTPAVGSRVAVGFLDALPTRPHVMGYDPSQGPAGLTLDATGAVRLGPTAGAVIGTPTTPRRLLREVDVYTAVGTVPGTVTFTLASTPQPSGPTKAEG